MSAGRARRSRLRAQLVAHLERLRDDGVWGLSSPATSPGPPSTARASVSGPPPASASASPRLPDAPSQRPDPPPRHADPPPLRTEPPSRRRSETPHRRQASSAADEPSSTRPPQRQATDLDRAHQTDLFATEAPVAAGAQREETLEEVEQEALGCVACRLHEGRTKVVFGVGDPQARLMFIGEGPGRDEDLQGEPFVGRAGKLLTRIIEAMDYRRQDVYIANAVKCRPPNNRNPEAGEIDACSHFLMRQIALVQPEIIVLLGRVSVQAVLGSSAPLSRLRGRFQDWRGIRVMCTYHPAYLLRNPSAKKLVWEDMQLVRAALDES